MDIGIELPVGVAFRMTDIFTEHRCFSAYIALQDKYSFDLLYLDYEYCKLPCNNIPYFGTIFKIDFQLKVKKGRL
jgi:hypothetical protein